MTRKDYVKFADAIRVIQDTNKRADYAKFIGDICKSDNANFKYTLFYKACNVPYIELVAK